MFPNLIWRLESFYKIVHVRNSFLNWLLELNQFQHIIIKFTKKFHFLLLYSQQLWQILLRLIGSLQNPGKRELF